MVDRLAHSGLHALFAVQPNGTAIEFSYIKCVTALTPRATSPCPRAQPVQHRQTQLVALVLPDPKSKEPKLEAENRKSNENEESGESSSEEDDPENAWEFSGDEGEMRGLVKDKPKVRAQTESGEVVTLIGKFPLWHPYLDVTVTLQSSTQALPRDGTSHAAARADEGSGEPSGRVCYCKGPPKFSPANVNMEALQEGYRPLRHFFMHGIHASPEFTNRSLASICSNKSAFLRWHSAAPQPQQSFQPSQVGTQPWPSGPQHTRSAAQSRTDPHAALNRSEHTANPGRPPSIVDVVRWYFREHITTEPELNALKPTLETMAWRELQLPNLLWHGPTLFGPRFRKLLCGDVESNFLRVAEDMLANGMAWVLGFRAIVRREAEKSLPSAYEEVTVAAFQQLNLLSMFKQVHRDSLYLYEHVKDHIYRNGHTYALQNTLSSPLKSRYKVRNLEEALNFLVNNRVVRIEDGRVSLPHIRKAEESLARLLSNLARRPCRNARAGVAAHVATLANQGELWPEEQVRAAEFIAANSVTILNGKGGCGKTHIVSSVFSCVEHKALLASAPTGRAARLLGHRMGKRSSTMHGVLYSNLAWHAALAEARGDRKNTSNHGNGASNSGAENQTGMRGDRRLPQWEYRWVQFLIVDEMSLAGMSILARVLEILLADAELAHVVLLGDVNQLPSVEPGSVLRDLCAAFPHLVQTLTHNHRAESQSIVDNAERVRRSLVPQWDGQVKLIESEPVSATTGDVAAALFGCVKRCFENDLLVQEQMLSQFVAFRRKDNDTLSKMCCDLYQHRKHSRNKYYVGDKICCRRNLRVRPYTDPNTPPERPTRLTPSASSLCRTQEPHPASGVRSERAAGDNEASKEWLCNGDIFEIVAIWDCKKNDRVDGGYVKMAKAQSFGDQKENFSDLRLVTLKDGDRVLTVDIRDLRRTRVSHGWARTIHTYQGSENKAIVYVLGDPRGQDWQHMYTAITRARTTVYIIAREQDAHTVVKSQPLDRMTQLQQDIQACLAEPLRADDAHRWDESVAGGMDRPVDGAAASMAQARWDSVQFGPVPLHRPSVPVNMDHNFSSGGTTAAQREGMHGGGRSSKASASGSSTPTPSSAESCPALPDLRTACPIEPSHWGDAPAHLAGKPVRDTKSEAEQAADVLYIDLCATLPRAGDASRVAFDNDLLLVDLSPPSSPSGGIMAQRTNMEASSPEEVGQSSAGRRSTVEPLQFRRPSEDAWMDDAGTWRPAGPVASVAGTAVRHRPDGTASAKVDKMVSEDGPVQVAAHMAQGPATSTTARTLRQTVGDHHPRSGLQWLSQTQNESCIWSEEVVILDSDVSSDSELVPGDGQREAHTPAEMRKQPVGSPTRTWKESSRGRLGKQHCAQSESEPDRCLLSGTTCLDQQPPIVRASVHAQGQQVETPASLVPNARRGCGISHVLKPDPIEVDSHSGSDSGRTQHLARADLSKSISSSGLVRPGKRKLACGKLTLEAAPCQPVPRSTQHSQHIPFVKTEEGSLNHLRLAGPRKVPGKASNSRKRPCLTFAVVGDDCVSSSAQIHDMRTPPLGVSNFHRNPNHCTDMLSPESAPAPVEELYGLKTSSAPQRTSCIITLN